MSTKVSIEFNHVSVLLNEAVDALNVKKDGLYLDGTLGGGGHTHEILKLGGRVFAIDRDSDAINYCKQKLSNFIKTNQLTITKGNFFETSILFHENLPNINCIQGAVLDLGFSSFQVDEKNRGFSYTHDAAIDMRMDKSQSLSAFDIINDYSEYDLAKIFYEYGEERLSRKIAREIISRRKNEPIKTTGQLSALIHDCYPKFFKGGHPAKKVFQALRITVNDELDELETALLDIFNLLESKARLSVITFHSLEDRIVKKAFSKLSTACTCDKSQPICVCGGYAKGRQIIKGDPPSKNEQQLNSRSRSARLRVIEKN